MRPPREPLVSLNTALLGPYFLGVNVALGGSGPLDCHDTILHHQLRMKEPLMPRREMAPCCPSSSNKRWRTGRSLVIVGSSWVFDWVQPWTVVIFEMVWVVDASEGLVFRFLVFFLVYWIQFFQYLSDWKSTVAICFAYETCFCPSAWWQRVLPVLPHQGPKTKIAPPTNAGPQKKNFSYRSRCFRFFFFAVRFREGQRYQHSVLTKSWSS